MIFKKSFFGYNCDAVNKFIEETTAENNRSVLLLKEKIDDLNSRVSDLNSQNDLLKNENGKLKKELMLFKEKCDEIELLSQKIGLMYLVTATNSKCINDMAKKNAEISENVVEQNLNCIDDAHKKFNELKKIVNEVTDSFKEKIHEVNTSLENAKAEIDNNRSVIDGKINETNSLEKNNYAKIQD